MGYSNIQLDSKQYGSNTGPRDFKVQYSLDQENWNNVPNGQVTVGNNWTSGVLKDLVLPRDTENQPVVYVRWTTTSTTSINGGTVASGGTSRIDQIFINGVAIQSVPVTGISVDKETLSLNIGDTDTITATIAPGIMLRTKS